ncbi:Protein UGT-49, partial [Aphelenchoides avenae]
VLWIPEIKPKHINGTKLAKVVVMKDLSDSFVRAMQSYGDLWDEDPNKSAYTAQTRESDALADVCESILQRKEELDYLKNYGFDVAFSDMIDLCDVGLAHYFGVKAHLWVASGPLHEVNSMYTGVPVPISYVPALENNPVSPVMNFFERVQNFHAISLAWLVRWRQLNRVNELFRTYVSPDYPDVGVLASQAALCFANSDEFVDVARPVLHKTPYIGGVGIGEAKPLEKPFSDLLQKGLKGVVLVSFGTAAPTTYMNARKKKAMFKVFAELSDYQFIMKVSEGDDVTVNLTKSIANVDLIHWMPQTDALGHSRVRLFISHGGYNSIIESAMRGVPMVVIPLFFDQQRNAKVMEYRGFGKMLERSKLLDEVYIRKTISEVLHDQRYRQNAQRLSKLIRSKPFGPDETLLKWTNFVIEHGNLTELIPEGTRLNFFVYHSFDVLGVVTLIAAFVLYVLYRLLRFAVGLIVYNGKLKID